MLIVLLATACSAVLTATEEPAPISPPSDNEPLTPASTEAPETISQPTTSDLAGDLSEVKINRRVEIEQDISFPTLLPKDGILPVYDPEFSPADEAPLEDEELIIGISLNGEAKAYPITVLRTREMVNDDLGGRPILVTW